MLETRRRSSEKFAPAAVFLSGIIFILLTLTRAREALVDDIPVSLKYAISVGIGFFIALIGIKNAGSSSSTPPLEASDS